jgi:hypothetical protein
MMERHKNEFADILNVLKQTGSIPNDRFNKFTRFCKQPSLEQSSSRNSFQQADSTRLEESFTIYIGLFLALFFNFSV